MKIAPRIFISYARYDTDEVKHLYDRLFEEGLRPWMDVEDILGGELWEPAIRDAIRSADFFLVCLSSNSVNRRGMIRKELGEALKIWEEKLSSDIFVIPVRLEDCQPPKELVGFQWVDLFQDNGWARLMKSLRIGMERRGIKLPGTKGQRLSSPTVAPTKIEESGVVRAIQQYLSAKLESSYQTLTNVFVPDPAGAIRVGDVVIGKNGICVVRIDHKRMPTSYQQIRFSQQILQNYLKQNAKQVFDDERLFHSLEVHSILVLVDQVVNANEVTPKSDEYFRICTKPYQAVARIRTFRSKKEGFLNETEIHRIAKLLHTATLRISKSK